MTTVQEYIDEAKRHEIVFKNRKGEFLLKLSLFWAILMAIAAPQLLPVVLILMLLSVIDVEFDGRPHFDLKTDRDDDSGKRGVAQ